MKLHIPKKLLTAVLAACVAPAAWAGTYDLLASKNGWTMSAQQAPDSRTPVYHASDAESGTNAYISTTNWGQALAVYRPQDTQLERLGYTVGDDNTFTFSATMITDAPGNSVLGISLVGSAKSLAYGTLKYNTKDIVYGTTENVADVYLYEAEAWNDGVTTQSLSGVTTSVGERTAAAYTLSGTVTLTDGNYMLDLYLNGNKVTENSVNLGTNFDVSRISLQADGGDNQLTALTVTGNVASIRYNAQVNGIVDIADVIWDKNGNKYATSSINLTNGGTHLGLSGTDSRATMVFESDVKVAAIDITQGTVTLQSDSNISTGELCLFEDSNAYINATVTSEYVSGEGDITILASTNTESTTTRTVTLADIGEYSGTVTLNDKNTTLKIGNDSVNINSEASLVINAGTLSINGVDDDQKSDANSAQKIGGTLTLGAGVVNIEDGSYNFAGGITIASGKKATIKNSWDKNQFVAGLKGDSTTELNFERESQTQWGTNYSTMVLTEKEDFSGTINLVNNNAVNGADYKHGITVKSTAKGALEKAVINFGGTGYGSVLVFSDTVENADGEKTDGAVGGLSGDKGKVYAKALTINVSKDKEYSFGGEMNIGSLIKQGLGSQTLTGNMENFRGSLEVEGGLLALTDVAEVTVSDLTVTSGAELSAGTVNVGSGASTRSTEANKSTANLQGGAKIAGNLDLSNASILTLNGIGEGSLVNITGEFVLPAGSLTLSGNILETLTALEGGSQLNIFSVGGFTVGGENITADFGDEKALTLDKVFTGHDLGSDYYLGYIAPAEGGNGTVYIGKIVPEPTTATLSLLALAALAARRRRATR